MLRVGINLRSSSRNPDLETYIVAPKTSRNQCGYGLFCPKLRFMLLQPGRLVL